MSEGDQINELSRGRDPLASGRFSGTATELALSTVAVPDLLSLQKKLLDDMSGMTYNILYGIGREKEEG